MRRVDDLQDFLAREETRLIDIDKRASELKEHLERVRSYALRHDPDPLILDAIQALAVEVELTRALQQQVSRRVARIVAPERFFKERGLRACLQETQT